MNTTRILFVVAAALLGVNLMLFAGLQPQTAHAQTSNLVMFGGPFGAMDEQTEQYIKDYLISVIQNNMTDMSFSMYADSGRLTVSSNGALPTDFADDISVHIGTSMFSEKNGYTFENGEITAPNGMKILPREGDD